MEKIYLSDCSVNRKQVHSVFGVLKKDSIIEKNGRFYFKGELVDKSGMMSFVYWGGCDEERVYSVYDSFKPGDVVRVNGRVDLYKNKFSIAISDGKGYIEKAQDGDYTLDMFLKKSVIDIEESMRYITQNLKLVKDTGLSKLLHSIFEDEIILKKFKECPAALMYHHPYVGGLVEHTHNVLRIGSDFCAMHSELDRDYVIAGAVLHDIGKIRCYDIGIIMTETIENVLLNHIVTGIILVLRKADLLQCLEEDKLNRLLHIIASHHGKLENGSPVLPKIPEAVAVFKADDGDSALKLCLEAKARLEMSCCDFKGFERPFGEMYLNKKK